MAIAMLVDNPDGSQEVYEKVRADLGLEAPAGGIVHLAGPGPNGGWRVIEVWDSVEEASRFLKERFGIVSACSTPSTCVQPSRIRLVRPCIPAGKSTMRIVANGTNAADELDRDADSTLRISGLIELQTLCFGDEFDRRRRSQWSRRRLCVLCVDCGRVHTDDY